MKIFRSIDEYQKWRACLDKNLILGLVPTMGALHEGHAELFRRAKKENDFCVGTIFVNPKQFNNAEDFAKYPNTQVEDLALLSEIGCDAVLLPTVDEVYPKNFVFKDYPLGELDKYMEGAYRNGHFDGVANVVKRLFDVTKPHKAYFGEKDFQQLQIIKKMVELENLSIEIVNCKTVRNEKNLALSSRNKRLTKDQLEKSIELYKILSLAKEKIKNTDVVLIEENAKNELKKHSIELEYLCFCRENELKPLVGILKNTQNIRAFIAGYLGEIRLIDNLQMY